ncbi:MULTISPECIES: hypothetical protein [Kosakonia]|uniref:hypothetical protein n=1 Tax=Kosakonia TaxID=1330547 RepID=UPI0013641294|nr:MULTISPECIES: hypothetical protein [Kosakonia]
MSVLSASREHSIKVSKHFQWITLQVQLDAQEAERAVSEGEKLIAMFSGAIKSKKPA